MWFESPGILYKHSKCSVGSLSCPPFMGQIILKCKTLLVPLPLVTLMVLLYPSFLLSVLHTFSCLPAFTHIVCCTWNILLPIIPNDLAIFHLSFVPHLKLYFLLWKLSQQLQASFSYSYTNYTLLISFFHLSLFFTRMQILLEWKFYLSCSPL